MKEICEKEKCIGCLNCYNSCKFSAINLIEDDLGFVYATKDLEKCKQCGICEKKCPILNKKSLKIKEKACYACKNIDDEIRMKSSSGGIFYLIANEIIKNNGIVYGAKYDDKFNVVHKGINKSEDIYKLMGSKYVQSELENIFEEIRGNLNNNILVLFTGTPCQVAALKNFLNKDYSNLITQDFICHGVGSRRILEKHIQEIKEKHNINDIRDINFRNKITGWKKFSFSISGKNQEYNQDLTKDYFMKSFLKNLCLRESCYSCAYKGDNRVSDITLGDFWGIERISKDFDDDKGVSAVMLNSEKGKEIFEKIKCNVELLRVTYKDISENNICLDSPAIRNHHRGEFIKDINSNIKLENINEEYYKR